MNTRTITAIVLLLLAGYGIYAGASLVRGPVITLTSPAPFVHLEDGTLRIEGKALHTDTLWLNGAPLLMDESGRFSTILTLPSGGAILSLTATDRFGRERTVRRSVFSS